MYEEIGAEREESGDRAKGVRGPPRSSPFKLSNGILTREKPGWQFRGLESLSWTDDAAFDQAGLLAGVEEHQIFLGNKSVP